MPEIPKKPCSHIGCKILTRERYCPAHVQDKTKYDRYRGSSAERGYGGKWRRERKVFLLANPLCVSCLKLEVLTESTVVDHIIPHRGDMKLFWDRKNWQALCKKCHDTKTAKEDGGFGRDLK